MAEIVFEKKGYKGLIKYINSNTTTEVDTYKTTYKITKLNKIQFEITFTKKLKDSLVEIYSRYSQN